MIPLEITVDEKWTSADRERAEKNECKLSQMFLCKAGWRRLALTATGRSKRKGFIRLLIHGLILSKSDMFKLDCALSSTCESATKCVP